MPELGQTSAWEAACRWGRSQRVPALLWHLGVGQPGGPRRAALCGGLDHRPALQVQEASLLPGPGPDGLLPPGVDCGGCEGCEGWTAPKLVGCLPKIGLWKVTIIAPQQGPAPEQRPSSLPRNGVAPACLAVMALAALLLLQRCCPAKVPGHTEGCLQMLEEPERHTGVAALCCVSLCMLCLLACCSALQRRSRPLW